MAASFYEESGIDAWKQSFELYEEILKRKAESEKKDKAKKLLELDQW